MTLIKLLKLILIVFVLYSCSPINKQHGYLLDDVIVSSDKIAKFEVNKTNKSEIYSAMGSPSIEITDIDHTWIYLISLKEKHVFEDDKMTFQTIFRFIFNDNDVLVDKTVLNQDQFRAIAFSNEKTKVRRDAYGITDQLYDAFTRGQ